MKVLVTGAAGFIGSAVSRALASQGVAVVGADALLGGLYPSTEKEARFRGLSELPRIELHTLDLRSDDLGSLP